MASVCGLRFSEFGTAGDCSARSYEKCSGLKSSSQKQNSCRYSPEPLTMLSRKPLLRDVAEGVLDSMA